MKRDRKNKLTKYFIIILIVSWFGIGWHGLGKEWKNFAGLYNRLKGLSDNQKRAQLLKSYRLGETYQLFKLLAEKSPESATIFISQPNEFLYFFGSYYLYPRRVLVASPEKIINGPELRKIYFSPSREWLKRNKIDYIITYDRVKNSIELSRVDTNVK